MIEFQTSCTSFRIHLGKLFGTEIRNCTGRQHCVCEKGKRIEAEEEEEEREI